MSFRFIFWTFASCLIVSGVAGWLFFGERDVDPEEQAFLAYQVSLNAERRSAERGGVEDWTRYARSLVTGPASLRDPKSAMQWYRKAADQGYPPAQVGIGDLFTNGYGVREDHYRAQEWYKVATQLSRNQNAHFKVGEGFFRGLGAPQDYGRAVKHYLIAAQQGHPVAQYLMGSMYEAGWGITRDLIDAWVWYQLALPQAVRVSAHVEDYSVAEALKRIEATMNQSQIDAAKKRLSALKK